jgi:hypothetical protein
MTEEEANRLRPDGVMRRLAKMLADATKPPSPRDRLREALVNGDFDALLESGVDGADGTDHDAG